MIKIAICDDNKQFCADAKDFFASILGNTTDYRLHIFHNGLRLINSDLNFDILILDVEMPFMDGFTVAEELNKRGSNILIIFLTSHAEMMQKAFKVKAFRYLVKPVDKKELRESIMDAINDIFANAKVIVDSNTRDSREDILVYEKDIIYVESIGDNAAIYTVNQGNLISHKPLRYWDESLTKALFFQTHKSYIVSLKHVASVRRTSLTTTNGVEIPLSKRKAALFKEHVDQYLKSML